MKFIQGIKRRLLRHKKLIERYANEETVFIYQMGKVGSTTIENSIKNAVHFIYRIEQGILAFILRAAFKKRKKTKIVTLVREPIKRNISMFFHDLDAYLFMAHTNCLNSRNMPLPTRNQSLDLLTEVFNQEFDHEYPINWFDKEFKPMTGINIYETAFDIDKGCSFIKNKGIEVLCIRTDKIKNCINELSRFVNEEVDLSFENQAELKWYGDLYQQFKSQYRLPNNKEQSIKQSKFYRHFFKK